MPRETIDIQQIYLRVRKPDVAHWLLATFPAHKRQLFHLAFRRKIPVGPLEYRHEASRSAYAACHIKSWAPIAIAPKEAGILHISLDMVLVEDRIVQGKDLGLIFYLHPSRAHQILVAG